MPVVMTVDQLESVEVFSRWIGFADPPSRSSKMTITRHGHRFVRESPPDGAPVDVPTELIADLLEALARPPVPELDPSLFELPADVIRSYYGSAWTDDYPELLLRMTFQVGRIVEVRSGAQHGFMLPLHVLGPTVGGPAVTYDPRASRAIARLLPDRFVNQDRLGGRCGMLQATVQAFTGEPASPRAEHRKTDVEPDALSAQLLRHRSLDEVRALLVSGADPNVADDVGQTALMHATFPPSKIERFRLLVDAGANVEARRIDGLTGLHLACAGGMSAEAAEWIKAGADVHARTPDGSTPLMLAAGWPKIVRSLLDAGADVHAQDNDGDTALSYAVDRQSAISSRSRKKAIRLLLDAGADARRPNKKGGTPLAQAERKLLAAKVEVDVSRALCEPGDPGVSSKHQSRSIWLAEERTAREILSLLHSGTSGDAP